MPTGLPFRTSDAQQRLELESGWEFLPDPTAKLKLEQLDAQDAWRPARVGLSWNVQFEDLREYMGAAWYRTRFDLRLSGATRHVLLKFGAVDYYCDVYVNGKKVGSHEGGYTPFSFDISSALNDGSNDVAIRVVDPPMDEAQNHELFPEMLYNEIPHGKQNWYVQNSGIWQGVRLEFAPAVYIDAAHVTPTVDGAFQVAVHLKGEGLTGSNLDIDRTRVRTTVFDNAGRAVWESVCPLVAKDSIDLLGKVQEPRLWGPSQPALYTLDVSLEGAYSYRRRTRFGFRELVARDGNLYFNGKPFFMVAALDQDFYPETIHTPASEEFVRDMMLKAKKLGINVLRCHLKVAHPVYLDVADELGLLVWAELPSWSDCWFPCDHFSENAARRAEHMFGEVMVRDWNHPCVVVQTIMNESWGINLKEATQRQWLIRTFDRVKDTIAPLGRLVIDNSACEGNFHVKSDLEDFHNYYSQPDQADLWDTFVREMASRPEWTFSPFGDAQRTGAEPIIISEFGNWGLPKLPNVLPWWFEHAFGEREVTRPAGVFDRFHRFKLDRIFSEYNDIAEETQWHQFYSLKYEIESMRSTPTIKGYCVTGMTDVHWEVNGLLDMWRNDKVFADEVARLQQPDLVMLRFSEVNHFAGAELDIPVVISHYSARDLAGSRVRWSSDSGGGGSFLLGEVPAGTATQVGRIQVRAPEVFAPAPEDISIELRSKTGTRISENHYRLYVYPQPKVQPISLMVRDPQGTLGDLERELRRSRYPVQQNAATAAVLITSSLDDDALEHLRAGGRAIVLADSLDALPASSEWKCTKRAATWLDGRWFSNYNWIDPKAEPYTDLAFHRILAYESRHVVPQYVIENVAPEGFNDVLSGITLGWLNLNNALTLQMRVRDGKALLTTFRFDRYGQDPYATHLLDRYIQFVASDLIRPGTEYQEATANQKVML
jgi:Glycosyl hydrolases family 2, sugar binding domain/Glycosyl hydrolases family 2/Glycosyl hydrolases family 2, TIM barrel domain